MVGDVARRGPSAVTGVLVPYGSHSDKTLRYVLELLCAGTRNDTFVDHDLDEGISRCLRIVGPLLRSADRLHCALERLACVGYRFLDASMAKVLVSGKELLVRPLEALGAKEREGGNDRRDVEQ